VRSTFCWALMLQSCQSTIFEWQQKKNTHRTPPEHHAAPHGSICLSSETWVALTSGQRGGQTFFSPLPFVIHTIVKHSWEFKPKRRVFTLLHFSRLVGVHLARMSIELDTILAPLTLSTVELHYCLGKLGPIWKEHANL
jgi:hypothetical protein